MERPWIDSKQLRRHERYTTTTSRRPRNEIAACSLAPSAKLHAAGADANAYFTSFLTSSSRLAIWPLRLTTLPSLPTTKIVGNTWMP